VTGECRRTGRRVRRELLQRLVLVPALTSCALLSAGTLAEFRTVFGTMEVELFDPDKPRTVQNFVHYVRDGLYRDTIIHRCPVNTQTLLSDFVIQGGGIHVGNRGATNWFLEWIPRFPDIPNEFSVGRRCTNSYGTIAMAKRGGDTNSANSEWFFNLGDNVFLDAPDTNDLFVVFGRVLGGTNVLERFKSFHLYTGKEKSNVVAAIANTPLTELPLLRPSLADTNLIFVDVSLLTANIHSSTDRRPEISWRSISNRVNRVEYSTHPPAWLPLGSMNGNGTVLRLIDTNAVADARFYRVRIDY
jgi:cyclophilin family peptidyl-prolyl cis-trans isomerase